MSVRLPALPLLLLPCLAACTPPRAAIRNVGNEPLFVDIRMDSTCRHDARAWIAPQDALILDCMRHHIVEIRFSGHRGPLCRLDAAGAARLARPMNARLGLDLKWHMKEEAIDLMAPTDCPPPSRA